MSHKSNLSFILDSLRAGDHVDPGTTRSTDRGVVRAFASRPRPESLASGEMAMTTSFDDGGECREPVDGFTASLFSGFRCGGRYGTGAGVGAGV